MSRVESPLYRNADLHCLSKYWKPCFSFCNDNSLMIWHYPPPQPNHVWQECSSTLLFDNCQANYCSLGLVLVQPSNRSGWILKILENLDNFENRSGWNNWDPWKPSKQIRVEQNSWKILFPRKPKKTTSDLNRKDKKHLVGTERIRAGFSTIWAPALLWRDFFPIVCQIATITL